MTDEAKKECEVCEGGGRVRMLFGTRQPCEACDGTGEVDE